MANKIEVAKTSELSPGSCKVVKIESQEIALYNVGGRFFATSNECIHQGGPLGEGCLNGKVITCPWHKWTFNVTTGENTKDSNSKVPCFPVTVEDDKVFIEMD